MSKIIAINKLPPTDQYVYDLEVEHANNFYANDILVHNSAGFICSPIVEQYCEQVNKTIRELSPEDISKILESIDIIIEDVNAECRNAIATKCHSEEPDRIEFKRESFSSHCVVFAKKKYFLRVLDKEGISTDEFKYTGVEVKKNELPPKVKSLIQELYERCCREYWTEHEYITHLRAIWDNLFKTLTYEDISFYKGYNTAREVFGFLKLQTGKTLVSKAVIYYNQLLEKLNILDKYEELRLGDKVRVCYILPNKYGIEVIGFKGKFPEEFKEHFKIDYLTMFQKMVLKPLEGFCNVIKWKHFDPRIEPNINVFGL